MATYDMQASWLASHVTTSIDHLKSPAKGNEIVAEAIKKLVTEILTYDREIDHALRHLLHGTMNREHKVVLLDTVAQRDKLMAIIARYLSTEFPVRRETS
jgi:hypothetical protein